MSDAPIERSETSVANARWIVALTFVFAVVHALYYAAGIRFDRSTLFEVMHFLDPELLRTRLLESVFYLHIQPPLMNLFTGLVLKVTPESAWLFQAIYLCLGLTLYLSCFLIQLRLGVPRIFAATLSILFMASPSFILWEHILLYTLPCAALLALAALLLFDVLDRGKPWAIAGFFLCVFLLCGMRSMFHIGYYVLLLVALLLACPRHRARLLKIALPLFLVLFAFYAKNLVLFGEFTACTFVEKNLWIMTVGNMSGAEKVRLVEEGALSDFAVVNRWTSMDEYGAKYQEVPERFRNIPALANEYKSTGAVNYNHFGTIAVSNVYGRDARYVLLHYPKAYLHAVAQSFYRYFIPGSALPVAPQNRAHIQFMLDFYDYGVYGKLPYLPGPLAKLRNWGNYPPHLLLLFGLPLLLGYGLYLVLPGKSVALPLTRAQRGVLLFLCLNIAMVAALGCAFDFLETARYRFKTDAFYFALLGMLLHKIGCARSRQGFSEAASDCASGTSESRASGSAGSGSI